MYMEYNKNLETTYSYMDYPQSDFVPQNKSEADYLRRMQIRQAFWQERQHKRKEDKQNDRLATTGLAIGRDFTKSLFR